MIDRHSQTSRGLPRDALGVGLRIPHYQYIFEHWPDVDYFEIMSENFFTSAPLPQKNLDRVLSRYPVVLHGVGLNLLGHEPLDESYLDQLCQLVQKVNPLFVSDHLCWTKSHNMNHHDLLPVPFVPDLIELAVQRIKLVQDRLGRPFALENLSSYLTFKQSVMSEWEFYSTVVRQAECCFMLDINNIYVSSQNNGFDPMEYLRTIDFSRVVQVHLAGHERQPNNLIIDTHNNPICNEVWELYQQAWKMGGPFPTLIEWDDAIPPMPELLKELEIARRTRS